jgi:DNA helicase-2/ATP-dependent DNA helicase PcrA
LRQLRPDQLLPAHVSRPTGDLVIGAELSARELNRVLRLPEPTDEQAAVIESQLGPAVVIAGAGSGKTETMAARVVWLVATRRVRPEEVLGLTFTRKAAAELGARIRRRLAQWRAVLERAGDADREQLATLLSGEPTVLTYAAYAARLVAEHALRVGAEPDARLVSPAMSWQLADGVSRRHPDRLPADIGAPSSVPRYVLELSAQLADHLVDPDDVAAFCDDTLAWFESLPLGPGIRSARPGDTADLVRSIEHRRALLPLLRSFAAAKAAVPALDFGDQMRIAAQLATLADVQQIERSRYVAVLLDEYQDTGHAQVRTLSALFGDGHAVTAVGDPFQSIYGWRGASAGNIGRFPETFPSADGQPAAQFALATSFRNDRAVLEIADAVVGPLRVAPGGDSLRVAPGVGRLRPAPGAATGSVEAARLTTIEDEARWVAARLRHAWDARPPGARTAAVLVRRRSQLPLLAEALLEAGLPIEVVGLGGLLSTPEVVDVVATLRVLVRHDAGPALARVLTGARWRVGAADLAALRNRARQLARPPTQPHADVEVQPDGRTPDRPAEPLSLIEALDDLGAPAAYSPAGFARLTRLSEELRRLRRRLTAPLPELVADVERTLGVDIEVDARPDRAHVGRVHLDRFLDEAAAFATEADEATLSAFLAYLDAAEDEENGLEAGSVVVESERVQLLTVHGAKGLEWDVVAVPGLVAGVFPADAKSFDWTRTRHELPAVLRGDRRDLPELDLSAAVDRREVRDLLVSHHAALVARHELEERRLAYVAMTRARSALLLSGYIWDNTAKPRDASPFLVEAAEAVVPLEWAEADAAAVNPLTAQARTALWPIDPLGAFPGDTRPGRRAAVEAGAALVRAALERRAGGVQSQTVLALTPQLAQTASWAERVDQLLAERAARHGSATVAVELPARLSVSDLVELRRDPAALAGAIRRPMPRPPAPWARRGTAFHTWLEHTWQAQTLLDLDQLPGAADESAADHADEHDFAQLRAAFERSEWAGRTPAEVEVPFEMSIEGTIVRGRMDAVFGNERDGWMIVDWKTGREPSGDAAHAVAIQLAAYRLAWARLIKIPDTDLGVVRAAFHYVRSGRTVEPVGLLDAAGLRALVRGRT